MKIKAAIFTVLGIICTASFVYPNTLIVGASHPYHKIGQALVTAAPYDTIIVQEGIYRERNLLIDKPIWILGTGTPTIDAGHEEAGIFVIASDSVVIDGFILINVGVSYLKEYSAIKVTRGKYGVISNNEIRNCFFGIYLEYANHFQILNNQISGQFEDEASAGNAIHVWKASNLEIAHNIVTGHRDGIYFEFVDESLIHHNKSINNLRYGLHFMFSNGDQYSHNEFQQNGAGVAVMFSRNIQMQENLFSRNWGGASYGLLLKEISDGKISGNKFIHNTIAILAEGANRIQIENNQFTRNGTALDIKGNCLDNRIVANNFLANTFEVVTNSRYSNNIYNANYWSSYRGYDLGGDGIGDEPYRPVSLFAKIISEIPSAAILLHSFFVNLMEAGEKIFPDIISAELVDENPRMKPYSYD